MNQPAPDANAAAQPNRAIKLAAAIFASTLIGGLLSRWHGGGFISGSPKLLKAFAWALPFALCAGYANFEGTNFFVSIGVGTIVLALTMLLRNTGHGGGMDLGHSPKEPGAGRDPEKLEYPILWARDDLDGYSYDLILLAIIGVCSVLPAGIAVGLQNFPAGALITLGGLGMPAGYALGWKVFPKGQGSGPDDLDEATEIGELLRGCFTFAALSLGFLIIYTGRQL